MAELGGTDPAPGAALPPPAYPPPAPAYPPGAPVGGGSRAPLLAAVITGVATIAAAVIATGGDSTPAAQPGPVLPTQAAAGSPSPVAGRSVQALPVQSPAPVAKKARIEASPDTGPRGSALTITGSGFAPGERVRISFRGSYGKTTDIRDVTAAADGGFAVEIKLPADYLNDQEKHFEASGLDSNRRADTPFTITG